MLVIPELILLKRIPQPTDDWKSITRKIWVDVNVFIKMYFCGVPLDEVQCCIIVRGPEGRMESRCRIMTSQQMRLNWTDTRQVKLQGRMKICTQVWISYSDILIFLPLLFMTQTVGYSAVFRPATSVSYALYRMKMFNVKVLILRFCTSLVPKLFLGVTTKIQKFFAHRTQFYVKWK
jgi:hypothetical protein